MPDDKTPDAGADNLDGAVSGKSGIGDINAEQLAALGGELDPIDNEDFSDADFGDELPEGFDPLDPHARAAQDKKDEGDEKDDDADKDTDKKDESEETDSDSDKDDDSEKSDDDADDDSDSDSDDDDAKKDPEEKTDTDAEEDSDDAKLDDEDGDDATTTADKADTHDEKVEKPKAKEQQIPKSRFDEVNARRRAAEEELERMKSDKAATEKAEEFDFDKAETEYMDMLLAGKTEGALAKRSEIRKAEQAAYLAHSELLAGDASRGVSEQEKVDLLIEEYEVKYDGFNPKKDAYSEDLMDEVAAMYSGYHTTGFTRSKALQLAMENVIKIYELPLASNGEPRTEYKEPEKKGSKKKPIKKVDEKRKAAKKQPANPATATGVADAGDTTVDIEKMSDEEMDALPEATLARLRGDTL